MATIDSVLQNLVTRQVAVTRPAPPRPAPANSPTTIAPHRVSPFVPPTGSMEIVQEFADVIQVPPAEIGSDYVNRCLHAAAYIGNPIPNQSYVKDSQLSGIVGTVVGTVGNLSINPFLSVINPVTSYNNERERSLGLQARSHVLATIDQVSSFATKAKNLGFSPPSNPYSEIARMNAERRSRLYTRLPLTQQEADDIVFNMKLYVDLMQAAQAGAIDLKTGKIDVAQLSHVRLSYDGFGGSGNTAIDMMKFLPSMDEIKKQQADAALSILDFKNRVPHLLFTVDYVPEQGKLSQGTIVAWKKIPDASGYMINRHDVFTNQDAIANLDNARLSQQSQVLMPYVQTYALGFLNDVDPKNVMMFLDKTVAPDSMYMYKIRAYQVQAQMKSSMFSVSTRPVSLTLAIKKSLTDELNRLDPSRTVSPWPTYADQLLGDSTYDWILAAANVRASITRGDTRDVTRRYSYLNADASWLSNQADLGKLVKPLSIDEMVTSVIDGIQKYGVMQVVQDILDETGITYYFEGRDPFENTSFTRAGSLTANLSNLFSVIASAIDPDTAVLNLKSLATNMTSLLNSSDLGSNSKLLPGDGSSGHASPKEVAVPDLNEISDTSAEGPIQYVNQLGDLRDSVVDLTTFEGISKLVRTIRIMSDLGPSRIVSVPRPAPAPVTSR